MTLSAGILDRTVRIERKGAGVDPDYGTPIAGEWELVAEVRAEVQEMLPSRGDKIADGIAIARRPARVRMRYRPDVTSDMRIVHGSRTMQIVAGPAVLGRNRWIELMCEDYSTAGDVA